MMRLFKLKRDELVVALISLVLIGGFTVLMLVQYSPLFFRGGRLGFWTLFSRNFKLSGYDCWSYIALSNGDLFFESSRHPLFYSLLYPLYRLNAWLMAETDINFAVVFMSCLTLFCAVFSMVLLYRILCTVVNISRIEAAILTLLFASFGHVMVSSIAPDHFILSLFFLLLTLYVSGISLQHKLLIDKWPASLLLFFTAGLSLTNGVKTLLSLLFVNRLRCFQWRFMAPAVVLPLLLLGGIYWMQHVTVEIPQQERTQRAVAAKMRKDSTAVVKFAEERGKWLKSHAGKPVGDGKLLELTDVSTSRLQTIIDNLFGESIQLHADYLLQDTSFSRPVFVQYRTVLPYIIETLIVLLLIAGLWVGRHQRFLVMVISWFGVDIILHLVLGFAINEIYIMTTGWIFIIPIALGFLLRAQNRMIRRVLTITSAVLALYLIIYNSTLLVGYLSVPYQHLIK